MTPTATLLLEILANARQPMTARDLAQRARASLDTVKTTLRTLELSHRVAKVPLLREEHTCRYCGGTGRRADQPGRRASAYRRLAAPETARAEALQQAELLATIARIQRVTPETCDGCGLLPGSCECEA